jgi:uncharacterized protein YggL (DUF469 family)
LADDNDNGCVDEVDDESIENVIAVNELIIEACCTVADDADVPLADVGRCVCESERRSRLLSLFISYYVAGC